MNHYSVQWFIVGLKECIAFSCDQAKRLNDLLEASLQDGTLPIKVKETPLTPTRKLMVLVDTAEIYSIYLTSFPLVSVCRPSHATLHLCAQVRVRQMH